MPTLKPLWPLTAIGLAALSAGCGSTGHARTSPSAAPATPTTSRPAALSAEATSAATGDIPDNQVFLVYTSRQSGFSIKYPEGWTQSGPPTAITFSDKSNLVRIIIAARAATGPTAPTAASLTAELRSLQRSSPSLKFTAPRPIGLPAGPAVRATYRTRSAPNPVTGKRVTLVVDRYELSRGGRVATIDLGTPVGVDNVDAYRMMVRSFRWL